MKKIQWLLVGAGDIAQRRVASALAAAKDSELAAVCDLDRQRADQLAKKFQVPAVFTDFSRALAQSGADAVYIATPHHLHVPMCLEALAANKHLLCEKPLGIRAAECLTLLDAVRKSDRITCCSNYRLFTNQFKATCRLIQSGQLGHLLGGWLHDEEPYFNPGGTPCRMALGMSPVLGFGFYLINMVQTLFGMPCGVYAMMTSFNCAKKPDYDIDDLETILLRFPDGRQCSILINNTAEAPLRHAYQFYCSKGRIYWPYCPPHFNMPIRKVAFPQGEQELPDSCSGSEPNTLPNWHLPMIEDFIHAVKTRTQPICTIESAVKTAVITDAIFKSAQTGCFQPVEWKEPQ